MKKDVKFKPKLFVKSELTDALYHSAPVSILSLCVICSILAWQLWGEVKTSYLLIWYVSILFVVILRLILYFWYLGTKTSSKLLTYHYNLFIIGSSMSAMLLGVVGSFLMPNNIMNQSVILILLSGIIAGATQSLRASFVASILYVLLVLVPVLIWEIIQILNNQMMYLSIFLAMSFFCFYSYEIAKRGSIMLKNHLELEYIHKMLLQRVSEMKEKYKEKATHDLLTGLYNHQFFNDFLDIEIAKAKRQNTPIAIIMLDLDHFKILNDTYGHLSGDIVLQSLGNILMQNVRKSDIACRYGGEEFVIVLPETTLPLAVERAELIRKKIKSVTIQKGSDSISGITASFGVAIFPTNGKTQNELIEAVDKALYQAKNKGRDRVCQADENNPAAVQ